MKPIDFRNHSFAEMRDKLLTAAGRSRVYMALREHGPKTTRELAAILNVKEVHTIRPRFTELYQHGFIDLLEGQELEGEGIYFARTPEEFEAWRAAKIQMETSNQQQLI